MATYVKFHQFVEDMAHKVHDLETDQLVVALTNTAPNASTDAVLADITEISYTNLSSRNLTQASSGQTSGTYTLDLGNVTLTASGTVPTFQYVVVYNDTPTAPADPLICYFDYGGAVDLSSGESFTINFDAAGLLQVA